MHDRIEKIRNEVVAFLSSEASQEEFERYTKSVIGRNGSVQELFDALRGLDIDDKRVFGPQLNALKAELETTFSDAARRFVTADNAFIDVTMLKKPPVRGSLHPMTIVREEVEDIFVSMGFQVKSGPYCDTEYNNFEALNIPDTHPARDMQDTFYLTTPGYVLRTHTSNMQNRILREGNLPIRAIVPGKVFRNEATDASHDYEFHQIEGIVVDRNVSVANMKYVMQAFLRELFQRDVKTRFRPGYFPFVEPGMELDFSCLLCDGVGCRVCKNSGWVEFLGCGMIHPNVLREGGIDPAQFSGFAFGMGLTRLVMMRYKIEDIRLLHSADLRFLEQFT